jgi:hypothetical protein
VIVEVRLPTVLLLRVTVRDVDVIHRRVVVLVGVRRQQMPPVLSPVQVVSDVEVLMPVLQSVVLMMPLGPGHRLALLPDQRSPSNPTVPP